MALAPDKLWLMHCSEGPIPRAAAAAVEALLPRELDPSLMRWQEDVLGIPTALRERIARVFGTRASDVTLTATTSSALTIVAQSYPWKRGDGVIAPLGEFPSNAWPWKALASRGVFFREVPLWDGHKSGAAAWETKPPSARVDPEARLLDAIGPATRIVAVSHVRFQDGLRLDLDRLAAGCKEKGVRLVVDGIQAAGTCDTSVAGYDAYASGGHKGLLAPQGLGFLTTSPEFREQLAPAGSWLSVEDCGTFSRPSTDFDRGWASDGTRFEQGVPNLLGCAALDASLRVIEDAGVAAIEAHVRELQRHLIDELAARPECESEAARLDGLLRANRLGSVVSLYHGGSGPSPLEFLLKDGMRRGIYASVREGYLRIAFHGWHVRDDVTRVMQWIDMLRSTMPG